MERISSSSSSSSSSAVAALLLMLVLARGMSEDVENRSSSSSLSGMPYWSKEAAALKLDGNEFDQDQLDGGFSSLEGMLQWAVGHSDPENLKDTADSVQRRSSEELKQGQMEIKDLMEKLKMPSDAQMMQIAIDDLNNSSLPVEDHLRALQELLVLVEPIDNANDLHKLGGIVAITRSLYNPNPEIRSSSAWVLGKASQNNPVVQNQILELGTLRKLIEMTYSNFTEEATKALFAISALVRYNLAGQDLFYTEAGDAMLEYIIRNSSIDIRLRRKSVFLLVDLVECQLARQDKEEPPLFSNHDFLKSLVHLMAPADLDLQEKVLYAVKNLLLLRSTNALVFKEVCKLDVVLENMRQQLQQLTLDDDFKEYALDMEGLRREVEFIFLQKLDHVKVRGGVNIVLRPELSKIEF